MKLKMAKCHSMLEASKLRDAALIGEVEQAACLCAVDKRLVKAAEAASLANGDKLSLQSSSSTSL